MLLFLLLLPLHLFQFVFFSILSLLSIWVDKSGKAYNLIMKIWASVACFLFGLRINTLGKENLENRTYLFLATHQSYLDIPILTQALPTIRFVYRKSLEGIPFFGSSLKRSHHIAIDREDVRSAMQSIENAAVAISNGASVVVFPEGTRSLTGEVQEFKRGAFMLALKANVPIVPVAIQGSYKSMKRGSWFVRPQKINVVIGKPIFVDKNMSRQDENVFMQKTREQIVQLLESKV